MKHQQGATLIIVLMVLLLIMLVGTLAIRQGMSSYKLVTNQQIQSLLNQNSDAVFMAFQNPDKTDQYAAPDGIIGFFKNPNHADEELVLCFSGAEPFSLNKAAKWQQGKMEKLSSSGGPCTATSSAGRDQVTTQVNIRRVGGQEAVAFADFARGTDITSAKTEETITLRLQATSILSGLVTNLNKIYTGKDSCVYKSAFSDTDSISQCLNANSTYSNIQVAEFQFLSDFSSSRTQP
jgi:hypothetical protein